jgi:RNA polymerase sigma-70 factor, ECF subfamily
MVNNGPESDQRLVARTRAGDADAREMLIRRYVDTAYAVALAIVHDRDEAEDVCQDSLVRALDHLADCRHPDRFGAWLCRIVQSRAHNARASRRVRAASVLSEETAHTPERASDGAERAELRRRLETALATLSEIERLVVLLHDLQGYMHKEIADMLDMSATASRQHLFVARKQLRTTLGLALIEDYTREP